MTDTHTQAPAGRKQVRAPIKEGEVQLRPGEYRGRDGQVLKRLPVKAGNKFDFPEEYKDPDWSYQWIRESIYNNTEYSETSEMGRAGWTRVKPDSLKGYFREQMPEGQNFISMEGLTLVERPKGMTEEAKAEALATANKHYQGQLHKIYDETAQLPSGFKPLRIERDFDEPEAAPQSWKPAHRPRRIEVEE